MAIYVLVASPHSPGEALVETIRTSFDESDRHEFRPGVWFVHSPLVTTAELRDQLGIQVGGHNGVVVAVVSGRFSGVADPAFVEKLQVWGGIE